MHYMPAHRAQAVVTHSLAFRFLNTNMAFPRLPESQLLVACAHSGTEPKKNQELVRLDLNWRRILEGAERYSVAPSLYTNLKKLNDCTNVPVHVMEQLKGSYLWHAIHNANLSQKLE